MAARGRKSSASLEIAQVQTLGRRPEPPLCLNDRAADEWRRIVNRMPSDWFTDETLSILQAHCDHVAEGEAIQLMIEKVRKHAMRDDESYKRYRDLLRDKGIQTRAALSCATKMRLTQQSSWTEQSSATAKSKAVISRPWDDS